jgi:hypothetical protein
MYRLRRVFGKNNLTKKPPYFSALYFKSATSFHPTT